MSHDLTPAQARALAAIAANGGRLVSTAPKAIGITFATVRALESRGLIELASHTAQLRWRNGVLHDRAKNTTVWTAKLK